MTKALVLALTIWVCQQTGLPLPKHMPVVHVLPGEAFCAEWSEPRCEDVRGYYDKGVVYLRRLDPENLRDLSTLVHEIVHHAQISAGVSHRCVGELEPTAYETEAAWLKQAGVKDPWGLMGTDLFTVATIGMCRE